MTKGASAVNSETEKVSKFEVIEGEELFTKVPPSSKVELYPRHCVVSEFESVRRQMTSLPSGHDFEVLQCIVGGVGSSGVYARRKAVAHRDWLRGELH